jgi:uncharacterized membrane protein
MAVTVGGRRLNTGQLWVAVAAGAAAALTVGSLAAPELVWDRFLWHYFWGPVFADANNALCATMRPAGPELLYTSNACAAAESTGVVAEPGYTLVSEVGYALALIFFLIGVWTLLRRLDLGRDATLFFALVPFMFFGGALRVVEDAIDAVPQGVEAPLGYPLNTLLISPVIYFTVFAITLGLLLASVYAAREGYADGYDRPLFYAGWALVVLTVLLTAGFVSTTLAGRIPGVGFYPQMTLLTLGLAAALAYGTYRLIGALVPGIHEGTGRIGIVVLFGHAVDGVANVLASDWLDPLAIPVEYSAKHPVNRIIVDVTATVQPEALSAVVGTSWPFLVVKLFAASLVIWLFDEEILETTPRYAVLMLVAILAVGLGPGTRDMLRATFGI